MQDLCIIELIAKLLLWYMGAFIRALLYGDRSEVVNKKQLR